MLLRETNLSCPDSPSARECTVDGRSSFVGRSEVAGVGKVTAALKGEYNLRVSGQFDGANDTSILGRTSIEGLGVLACAAATSTCPPGCCRTGGSRASSSKTAARVERLADGRARNDADVRRGQPVRPCTPLHATICRRVRPWRWRRARALFLCLDSLASALIWCPHTHHRSIANPAVTNSSGQRSR